jgi:hypothetical protein
MTRGGERRWEARRGGEGEEERGVVGVVRGGLVLLLLGDA